MKIKNKKYIIAIDKYDNYILDVLTYENGNPRYFKDKKSATAFLNKIYKQNEIEFNPFNDDGIELIWIN